MLDQAWKRLYNLQHRHNAVLRTKYAEDVTKKVYAAVLRDARYVCI
jgi:hypothetical protein